jgi:hypothetical protein
MILKINSYYSQNNIYHLVFVMKILRVVCEEPNYQKLLAGPYGGGGGRRSSDQSPWLRGPHIYSYLTLIFIMSKQECANCVPLIFGLSIIFVSDHRTSAL